MEGLGLSIALGLWANVAYCVKGLAQIAAPSHPHQALQLAAGAAAIRHGVGWMPASWEESLYEQSLATARYSLPPADAEAAWREGALLSRDAIVRLAVDEALLTTPKSTRDE